MLEAPRRAIWRQLARLTAQAAIAMLRRGARATARAAYGIYVWLVVLVVLLFSLPLFIGLRRQAARFRLAQIAARAILRGSFIPLAVEGLEHLAAGPAVIVVNHASYIDALVVLAALPGVAHFAAKREFERTPVFGAVLRGIGTCFVERSDTSGGIEDARELVSLARRGASIAIFPEGTFSRAPGLAAFRLGAFAVSATVGIAVIPIVLRGTRSVLREHRWLPIRYPIEVSVLPPVMPEGEDWSAAVRLRDRVRDEMLRRCGEPDLARPAT